MTPTRQPRPPRAAGFTLIELMIVVAIAAILSAVALPGAEATLQRVRRADALVSMMQIQLAQERYRSNALTYGNLADIGVGAVTPAGHYALSASAATPSGYEVVASATGTQARDAACRFLRLTLAGGNPSHASGADATLANADAANRKCWSL